MNNRERVLEYDFRPRVDEPTNDRVRRIAALKGIPVNVQIRQWILEGVRRDEAAMRNSSDGDVMFRRVVRLHG